MPLLSQSFFLISLKCSAIWLYHIDDFSSNQRVFIKSPNFHFGKKNFITLMSFHQTYTLPSHQWYVIKRVQIHHSDKFSSYLWIFIKLIILHQRCIFICRTRLYHTVSLLPHKWVFIKLIKINHSDEFHQIQEISKKQISMTPTNFSQVIELVNSHSIIDE